MKTESKTINFRISSVDSGENDSAVLVNGHFDTPPGSPGAGDCGSCVGMYILHLICFPADVVVGYNYLDCTMTETASILELARLSVDSGWIPPRPVIFLFNGAEELFMLVRRSLCGTNDNLFDAVLL